MAKFKFTELILGMNEIITARVGATGDAAGNLTDKEQNKIVDLAGDSQFDLVAVTEKIEGFINSVQGATLDGWTIGSVQTGGRKEVLCDGLEATPGTGVLAIGDYVVAGTVVAKDTDLTTGPKVCKATNQPGATVNVGATVDEANVDIALAKLVDQVAVQASGWKVISLGSAGTGAVGTAALIEKV